jgi:hypothetical protein
MVSVFDRVLDLGRRHLFAVERDEQLVKKLGLLKTVAKGPRSQAATDLVHHRQGLALHRHSQHRAEFSAQAIKQPA